MENEQGKIRFELSGSDESAEFYVLEQITVEGINYILVTDSQEEEAEAYILKEISSENEESVYEMVEDDHELDKVSEFLEAIYEDLTIER